MTELHGRLEQWQPDGEIERAAAILLGAALRLAATDFASSPVPRRRLEWLDDDTKALWRVAGAPMNLDLFRQLTRLLLKAPSPDSDSTEIQAAVEAIDRGLAITRPLIAPLRST